MPGALDQGNTVTASAKASTLSGVEVFVSCCGRGVTSGLVSASFVANSRLLIANF